MSATTPEQRTGSTDRDQVFAWFSLQPEEWVPVERFIEAWSDRLTVGQGAYDLRILVREGRLEKKVDYSAPRKGSRTAAVVHYRVRR